ncbi:acyl-CoA dehydrogenase family member 11-like isoform X2 [Serinus canaria]|uniref:acyl-CoA dehydrogenase family member 11-like isoform X2 n=1 Tax=Serinus canaria TaxID=9135 RepID=UPI0021CCA020|nr:acyl-CoA dehydrogenase family member 11-like isoform X2 [Serinus canaria]
MPSIKGINMTVGQEQQAGMKEKQVLEDLETHLTRRDTEALFQEQPQTGNQYLEDTLLRSYLKTHLPPKVLEEVHQDLERFGNRLLTKIQRLSWECELNPPVFRQFDAWGRRVDRIHTCSAWRRMKEISAEEGLIAEAYEKRYSNWSRLYQAVKLYLFSSSSGGFSCPLAMTDGAAKVIESLGNPGSLKNAFDRLTSRDPEKFWTSGQWMTERRGGSDVANGTETVARKQPDGTYRLYGFKWFTSAADSDMALTLARIADAEGQCTQGSRGLSLFFLRVRDEDGKLNNIQVQRLKDKLGTRQMATAELWLQGARAELISAEGRGVAAISNMLNITRIHNVIGAVASMRRMISLSRDYACKRVAFGKLLKDHPLHMQTLARMEASAVAVEAMESFGGQGYMEDTGLPVILRDALVLSIWEGTTNILSLDVLRSLAKSQGQVMAVFLSTVQKKLELASGTEQLSPAVQRAREAIGSLQQFMAATGSERALTMELAARDFSYSLARIYTGTLLMEHAARPDASSTDVWAALRWCNQELCPVAVESGRGSYGAGAALQDSALVFGNSRL